MRTACLLIFMISGLLPFTASAATPKATPLLYAVWIPYWREATGIAEVSANIRAVQEISPFSYEVRLDGTLGDPLKLGQEPWPDFFTTAAARKAKIIPTVAWIDGEAIQRTLASTTARARHIAGIADTVRANNFAGIDIDYENKKAETKPHFSAFIKELSIVLHKEKKILSCSIESRTPLASRFVVVPPDLAYANDFKVIGRYCDEVRILAYDQGTVDIKLNKQKGGKDLYAPVADIDWVKKVLQEAAKSIPAKKIMLGVPTFGYEYEVTPRLTGGWEYRRVRSVSYQRAIRLAAESRAVPRRNSTGEMSFTYQAASSTRLVWFPDAASAEAKIKLAKQFKLRGIAVFKADGESDPRMWETMK